MSRSQARMVEWRPLVEHTCWRCLCPFTRSPAEVVSLPRDNGPKHYVRCPGCRALVDADESIKPGAGE